MSWVWLLLAASMEIGFTTCIKLSEGFTKLWPSLAFLVFAAASFGFLTLATRTVPLGIAYAVWTSLGAAGTCIVGVLVFKDPMNVWMGLFLGLLIVSVVGLQLVTPSR